MGKTIKQYLEENEDARICICCDCENCLHARSTPPRINCAADDADPGDAWCTEDAPLYGIQDERDFIRYGLATEFDIDSPEVEIEDEGETVVLTCQEYR